MARSDAHALREALVVRLPSSTETGERGAMERELAHYRALFALSAALTAVLDTEGRVTVAADGWRSVVGIDPRAIVGRPFSSVVHPDDAASAEEMLTVLTRAEVVAAHELRLVTPDRGIRSLRCSAARDVASGLVYLVAHDITDLRSTEAAANAAREKAVQASSVKSRFLANMSHEIRTPMNAIIGMTSLVLDTTLTTEQREYLEIVQNSAESLLTIVNDLLDISKIEAGRLTINEVDFELRDCLRSCLAPLALRAKQKGLEFSVSVTGNVADSVRGDPVRLRQIITNLVNNAVKFTHAGSVRVSVSRDDGDASQVLVSVEDTGIGIPEAMQVDIFEAFLQADDSTTKHFGGTGLGLTICREIAELMGGRVWLKSEPGKGSTFSFTARLTNAAFWFDQSLVPKREDLGVLVPHAPPIDKTLRVLVAEDNPTNTKLVVRLLEKLGCQVVAVVNGALALAAATTSVFDLVLMDMQMPEMDGVEATRRIREWEGATHRHVPIVALTANAMKADADACLGAGMDDFLTKPIERALLSNLIERLRGQRTEANASGTQDARGTAG